ncbi:MAG: hypothetical protein HYT39_03080 [Candidatus Sungbacteria bacterium]|nr:hypothetical protein [Candidatus Sungbacteria bacterium]
MDNLQLEIARRNVRENQIRELAKIFVDHGIRLEDLSPETRAQVYAAVDQWAGQMAECFADIVEHLGGDVRFEWGTS